MKLLDFKGVVVSKFYGNFENCSSIAKFLQFDF